MAGLRLEELLALAVMMVGVAVCQQNPAARAPAAGFTCPQERGQFEAAGDCTRFYDCYGGVANLMTCPPQLIFNPQAGFCDWPHRVNNPNCAGGASALNAQSSQICRNNPGNPTEAFNAPHPELCNAFYTCSTSYIHPPCTFCGEGMYYSMEGRGCRSYQELGLEPSAVCGGRQFVDHGDKVLRQIDGTCWPFSNRPNQFQAIVDSIRSGAGSRPNPVRGG